MGKTGISWCDETWNPVVGCTPISAGCQNCYAKALHDMRHKAFHADENYNGLPAQYAEPFEKVQCLPERLNALPLRGKPRRVFVCSMADLFHKDVPFDFIDKVFAAMALRPFITFQCLSKRALRMKEYFQSNPLERNTKTTHYGLDVRSDSKTVSNEVQGNLGDLHTTKLETHLAWPLPNVWLGVTAENQEQADARIPVLLQTPAAVRFVSVEPMLGQINLRLDWIIKCAAQQQGTISLCIVGGESGPNARPMHPAWARSLRDQCKAAGVPFHFKQHGEFAAFDTGSAPDEAYQNGHRFPDGTFVGRVGTKCAGHLLDGVEYREFPKETIK